MGQGTSVLEDVCRRLVFCLNGAQDAAKLQALLTRGRPPGTTRYTIIVQEPKPLLRQVLRTLHLAVDLRRGSQWLMQGPDLALTDDARRMVFESAVRSLNEQLGRHGRFDLAMQLEAGDGRWRLVIVGAGRGL